MKLAANLSMLYTEVDVMDRFKKAADAGFTHVEMLPVIPNPEKILCVGLNYASHAGEVGRELPKVPSVFSRLHNTLVAQGGDIVTNKGREAKRHL